MGMCLMAALMILIDLYLCECQGTEAQHADQPQVLQAAHHPVAAHAAPPGEPDPATYCALAPSGDSPACTSAGLGCPMMTGCSGTAGMGWKKVERLHDMSDDDLDPLPFHVTNVALHGGVTCLVYVLALCLCAARHARAREALPAAVPQNGHQRDGAEEAAAAPREAMRMRDKLEGGARPATETQQQCGDGAPVRRRGGSGAANRQAAIPSDWTA